MTSDNFFRLLGLAVNYQVEIKQLTENYRQLQRSVHPDNYANASEQEQKLAIVHSAQINDAFQTLKNPLKRAIYLASLVGIEINQTNTLSNTDFLMEQMQLRENLVQVAQAISPIVELENLSTDIDERMKKIIQQLSLLFVENDLQHDAIKNNILKLQFLSKLQQECLDVEETISD